MLEDKLFKKAFTLLEITIVIIIVGTISTLALTRFNGATQKAEAVGAEKILESLVEAQRMYYIENGSKKWADTMAELDVSLPATPAGFTAPDIEQSTCTPIITRPNEYVLKMQPDGKAYCSDISGSGACGKLGYNDSPSVTFQGATCSYVAPPPPPSSCFPAGVKITMADKTTKNIEDINVGDEVLSYDKDNKVYVNKKVLSLDFDFTVGDHAEACASLGNKPALYTINNGLIEFTPEHPFLVKEGEEIKWAALVPDLQQHPEMAEASDIKLKVGQEILMDDIWVEIESITVSREDIPDVKVYNFHVEDTKVYIANGIVVHNKEIIPEAEEDPGSRGGSIIWD